MTTKVIIEANHGWPVKVMQVDPATLGINTSIVEANTTREFYIHSNSDLYIHEIQPEEKSDDSN